MSQRFVTRLAKPEDAPGLMELLADTPQQGSIQLNFERQPNYFIAAAIGTQVPELFIYEDQEQHRVAGAGSIGRREVYINGELKSIRYSSDLRIHRDYQGGRALLRMFKSLREELGDDWYQTVILEENEASLATVGSGRLKVQPTYYPAGQFRTNMIDLKRKEKHTIKHHIRRATHADVQAMQGFFNAEAKEKQFYPHYEFDQIGSENPYYKDIKLEDMFLAFKNDTLVGMTGLWDQKQFKQTRVTGYSRSMEMARPLYNIYTRIMGGLALPPAGSLLSYISLHTTVVKNNDSDIFADLLAQVRRELYGSSYQALVVGFDLKDPLQKITDQYKKVELFSRHFLGSYGDDPMNELDRDRIMYLETARL
ncbi:MAG: hypothetical protein P1U57_01115 [Oleibacter sp.]|nr:hypothetical protein [Thalassolituus sp.]